MKAHRLIRPRLPRFRHSTTSTTSTASCFVLIFAVVICSHVAQSQLVLGRPPVFRSPLRASTMSAIEGESVGLSCVADFAESLEWHDESGRLLSSAPSLEVRATREGSKVRCVAKNGIATALSPLTTIEAKYLDDFDHADGAVSYELTSSVGKSFILRRPPLIASQNIDISFSWFKDGTTQITSNSSHYVTSSGDLVIVDAAPRDFGTYKVVASADGLSEVVSNPYTVVNNGEPESSSFFIVYWPNAATIVESATPRDQNFDCVPSMRDGAKIRWFLDENLLTGSEVGVRFSSQNRRLSISNPSGFIKGEHKLTCKADASMGRNFDQKETSITFITVPHIRDIGSEYLRPLGSPLALKCGVKKKSSPSDAQWYFNGRPIVSQRGRYVIESLGSDDLGLYQCEVSNAAGSELRSVWVQEGDDHSNHSQLSEDVQMEDSHAASRELAAMAVPVEETSESSYFIKKPADAVVVVGTESHTFECLPAGNPPPTVTWMFSGHEIHSENAKYDVSSGKLTLHDIRKADDGEYVCVADGQKAAATLRVDGDSLIEYGPTDQKSLIGTNVEFSCEVSKDYVRKAQVEWYLNDVPLSVSGNSGLRISRNRKGSLIIRQVGPDNTGEYKCIVRVDGREESASATLQIIEKPAMPERVRAELHNETTPAKVRVSWSEGFDGNEPIIKHAIEMRTLGPTGLWSDWATAIDNVAKEDAKPCCAVDIDDLRPSVTAEFRVIAANKHGAGKPSQPSNNVTMPQQPPSAAPRNVKAHARSSHTLVVQWQQPREEHASGDVLGYVVRYRLAGYNSLSWNEKNVTTKDARNAVIDELITWREYEVQVAAYNRRGLGVFSPSVEVTTAEGVPTQAPKNVRVKVLNSTAVEVDFIAPEQQRIPGVNLGYKVEFWKGDPSSGVVFKRVLLDPDRRQLNVVVDDLEKFGHYNLTVLCYTSPGDGPRSPSLAVVTEQDAPDAVDALSIAEVMYNGAVVIWNPPVRPNGIITKYTIRHWSANTPDVKTKHEVDGSQTNVTIDGLQPSTRYGVDVMATTVKGDGPVEETKFESGVPPELPGRASQLSLGDVTATSAQLHFTPGFDGHTAIRMWIIEAKVADSSVFVHVFNISAPKARSINVTGLRPYTKYQLRLIAENVKGRGAPSEPTRLFETLQTSPESPSSRLFAEPVSATSISVSWSPLLATQWNGLPKGYLVVYREVEDEDWKEIRTSSLRASDLTLAELRPFADYEVNVFAENDFGRSEAAAPVAAKTYESVPSAAPRNIIATVESARTVVVQYESVEEKSRNGEILGYRVRIVPERESLAEEETREVDVPGYSTFMNKITTLRPFTAYQLFVSAYTIAGHGPENATPILFETTEDVPTSPESFQCSYVSESEVRLKWIPPNSPNGKITNYKISYWQSHELRKMAIDTTLNGNLLMFSATSLNPNTQYTFAIRAVDSKGESEETTLDVVTSSARVPLRNAPAPRRDEQEQHSATMIALRWNDDVADDAEAPIRAVQVSYQKTNEDEWTTVEKKFEYLKQRCIIKRLTPNSSYRFRIRFVGDFLESSWSSESEWMRTLPAPPLAPPISVKATPFDATSLQLSWVVPHASTWNSDAVGYRIAYREYPSNDTWQVEEIATSVQHQDREQRLVTKLSSFRHYIVRMRLFNSEGEGPFSNPAFVYVGYTIPKRNITGLVAEPLSSSSLAVRWDSWPLEDTDGVTSFKVRYVPVTSVLSASSSEEEVLIVDDNQSVLSDLRKFTEYQISVCAYNRAGEGRVSQLRATTLEDVPGPVGSLVFTDVLLDSVRVSWQPPSQPNGVVVAYVVNYKGFRMQEELKKEDQKRTTQSFFLAEGLTEGITYFFSVWAETAAGRGEERTANVTVGANPEGPAAPTRPVVVPGQSSVTLQWNDVAPSKDLIGHLVQAKRVAAAVETDHGYVSQRPRRIRDISALSSRPTHTIGEWVTLRRAEGSGEREHISYRELQPASFYVFRILARDTRGVGLPSSESEQLFVPESIPDDPFYTAWWFLALVAMAAFVCVVVIVAVLCITGSAAKYRREKRSRSVDSLQLNDGNFASFQLKGDANHMTRSRIYLRELPTRPGTTQSWLSEREPPAYGSVLSEGGPPSVVDMYGLATDVIPPLPNAQAMQRLSALVGRDVRGGGSAYVAPSIRGSDAGRNEYISRNDFAHRPISDYGRVEMGSRTPMTSIPSADDYDDSFDEESVDGDTIRGDTNRREPVLQAPTASADVYGVADDYRDTWHRVRDAAVVSVPSGPSVGRASSLESGSDVAWPSHNAPNLASGFSSFV